MTEMASDVSPLSVAAEDILDKAAAAAAVTFDALSIPSGVVTSTELKYWLTEGSVNPGQRDSGQAGAEAATVAAYQARDDFLEGLNKNQTGWTNNYSSLGADDNAVLSASWQRGPGLFRICFLVPVGRKQDGGRSKSDEKSKDPPGNDQEQDEGTFKDVYSFFARSLKGVRLYSDDASVVDRSLEQMLKGVSAALGTATTPPSGFRIEFPDGYRYLAVEVSLVLEDGRGDEILVRLSKVRSQLRTFARNQAKDLSDAQRINFGDVQFYGLLESADSDPSPILIDRASLTHAYHRIAYGNTSNANARLVRCPASDEFVVGGVCGIEGVILARQQISTVKTLVCPRQSAAANASRFEWGNDRVWGGTVFAAWLATVYQHAAIIGLAEAFAAASAKDLDPTNQAEYAEQVVLLETGWMYREFSNDSRVDRIYRCFQKTYDIEDMWTDVREQTEMTIRIHESRRAKTVSTWQNAGGFIFGSLILLAGIFGMNFKDFDEGDWKMQFSNASHWTIVGIVLGAASAMIFEWFAQSGISSPARSLRRYLRMQGSIFWAFVRIVIYVIFAGFVGWVGSRFGPQLRPNPAPDTCVQLCPESRAMPK